MLRGSILLVLLFASVACFKKEEKNLPPEITKKIEEAKELAEQPEETPKLVATSLTDLMKPPLQQAKDSIAKLSSAEEQNLVEKYLAYIEKPSSSTAKQFSQAMVGLVKTKSTPHPLSIGGLFESNPYSMLSVRWSNWIESGDEDAITALLVYEQAVATDGAESEIVFLNRDTVHSKFKAKEAKAQLSCREYFADAAASFRDGCLRPHIISN